MRPEFDALIARTPTPGTVASIAADLRTLGVRDGMVLLVHSSLSRMGWVCGGAAAVILALEQTLGDGGTLVMPTHTSGLSDPGGWSQPPIPEAWWDTVRAHMPPYDPDLTPTRAMGVIPETFRKQAGTLRSRHPHVSFAARGPHATTITQNHSYAFGLGEETPLARVYDLAGWILLLGVGHGNNTSLHLAECRADFSTRREETHKAPVTVDGERRWVTFQDMENDDSDFETLGMDFAQMTGHQREGRVAQANALLMPQRALVDHAVGWMERNRRGDA